jgi:hypothetical protein
VRELQRGTAKVSEGDCLARIRIYIQSAELLCGIPRAGLTASPNISPSTDGDSIKTELDRPDFFTQNAEAATNQTFTDRTAAARIRNWLKKEKAR